jgi:hypothetical protein
MLDGGAQAGTHQEESEEAYHKSPSKVIPKTR